MAVGATFVNAAIKQKASQRLSIKIHAQKIKPGTAETEFEC